MGLKISKILNSTKTKWFWAYILIGALFMLTGVTLCSPLWLDVFKVDWFFATWGDDIVKLVISAILILYIVFFLSKRIRGNGVVRTLTVVEIILLSLIALGGILAQFNVLPISDASKILGSALWLRGTVEIFHSYYYHANENERKYPTWMVVVSIILITAGTYLFVTNKITNRLILWIMVIALFLAGFIVFVWGFIKKPIKPKKEKVKKEKVKKEKVKKEKVKKEKTKKEKVKKVKPAKTKAKKSSKKATEKTEEVVEEVKD